MLRKKLRSSWPGCRSAPTPEVVAPVKRFLAAAHVQTIVVEPQNAIITVGCALGMELTAISLAETRNAEVDGGGSEDEVDGREDESQAATGEDGLDQLPEPSNVLPCNVGEHEPIRLERSEEVDRTEGRIREGIARLSQRLVEDARLDQRRSSTDDDDDREGYAEAKSGKNQSHGTMQQSRVARIHLGDTICRSENIAERIGGYAVLCCATDTVLCCALEAVLWRVFVGLL